jgi:hypothetical protein
MQIPTCMCGQVLPTYLLWGWLGRQPLMVTVNQSINTKAKRHDFVKVAIFDLTMIP